MMIKSVTTLEDKALLREILEDLNLYIEHFIGTEKIELLRSKLRFLHQKISRGELKSLIRGTLTYLKRWPLKKVWLRLSTILQNYTSKNKIKSLNKIRIIENHRFMGHGAVLTVLNGPKTLAIKHE